MYRATNIVLIELYKSANPTKIPCAMPFLVFLRISDTTVVYSKIFHQSVQIFFLIFTTMIKLIFFYYDYD